MGRRIRTDHRRGRRGGPDVLGVEQPSRPLMAESDDLVVREVTANHAVDQPFLKGLSDETNGLGIDG